MSDDQLEIEEAVKYFNGELREAQVTEIHAKPLVNLAQRYLSVKCPEKKNHFEKPFGKYEDGYKHGYNDGRDDYRLFQLKEDERKEAEFRKKLEGIHEVINKVFDDVEAPSQKVYTEDISIALQTYLMDKERGK